tara:strand:- start:33 stop:368 length:336 start_codon:yes stop_codon:yes gene_type:complete
MAEEQGTIASLIGDALQSIGDALKRDELEAPNNDLSTRMIGNTKVVVRGAVRDKNGKLTGGTILGPAGSEEKTGKSIATKTGRPQGNLLGFKRGGSIKTKKKKLKNFKGTF